MADCSPLRLVWHREEVHGSHFGCHGSQPTVRWSRASSGPGEVSLCFSPFPLPPKLFFISGNPCLNSSTFYQLPLWKPTLAFAYCRVLSIKIKNTSPIKGRKQTSPELHALRSYIFFCGVDFCFSVDTSEQNVMFLQDQVMSGYLRVESARESIQIGTVCHMTKNRIEWRERSVAP